MTERAFSLRRRARAGWRGPLAALLLLAAGLLCLPSASAAAAGELALNTAHGAPRSRPDNSGFEDRIVLEAFRRIGVAAKIAHLSAERTLQNINLGIDDGNYARIAGLDAQYPNLVMVPEPVSEFRFTVFTRDPDIAVLGWEGLKPYSVGIITGWKIVEAHTTDVRSLTTVKDEAALFALLDKGRVELVVNDLLQGQETLRQKNIVGVRALSPPLERRSMYLYLHKRHAELAPRLAQALRQMKRDGTFQRLTKAGQGEVAQ